MVDATVSTETGRRLNTAFWLFTVAFVAAMFLPRLVTKGMFGDGVLYAAMARNLAEGRGSWWTPFFSNGYWVENLRDHYFENPPLMLWVQSFFFRLAGDHWWTEKLYSGVLLAVNCFLLARIWEIPLRATPHHSGYAWLPVFLFYLIPVVIWGAPNNLMDSSLLCCCLLAIKSLLEGLTAPSGTATGRFWLAGVFVFLALLTKGPVGLYPLAAPVLYYFAYDPPRWLRGFRAAALATGVAAGLFAALLWLHEPARVFFQNYWEQRLSVALAGGREDGSETGWRRLYVLQILARELLPIAITALLVWGVARWRKHSFSATADTKRPALFFLLLGLFGTLPLAASGRQSGMYLIPSLPMFALAAGYFLLPALGRFLDMPEERRARFARRLQRFSVAGLAAALLYSGALAGTLGRERALQRDIEAFRPLVPEGEALAVCEAVNKNFVYHTYLQRFRHIELHVNAPGARFFCTDTACDAEAQAALREGGFNRKIFAGEVLNIYKKAD